MFHKAIDLAFGEGTKLQLTFQNGFIKEYDISILFDKYPQLEALKNREMFLSGKLMGAYGIMWNDELDLEAETIYEEGTLIGTVPVSSSVEVAQAVLEARARAGLSQKQVASLTGIDQADISKIERGIANPSISTLERIANALGGTLSISIKMTAW